MKLNLCGTVIAVACLPLFGQAPAANARPWTVTQSCRIELDRTSPTTPPKWDQDRFLLRRERTARRIDELLVFDRSCTLRFSFHVEDPEVSESVFYDAASHGDYVIIAGAAAARSGQRAAVLWVLDGKGSLVRTIRTSPFNPRRIRVSPEGLIWALGGDFDGPEHRSARPILQSFRITGEKVHEFIRRNEIQSRYHPASASNSGEPLLLTGHDWVGVYLAVTEEFFDVQPSTGRVHRTSAPLPVDAAEGPNPGGKRKPMFGAAVARSGVVAWLGSGPASGRYRLDRAGNQWVRDTSYGREGVFLGVDGSASIAWRGAPGARFGELRWLVPSSEP